MKIIIKVSYLIVIMNIFFISACTNITMNEYYRKYNKSDISDKEYNEIIDKEENRRNKLIKEYYFSTEHSDEEYISVISMKINEFLEKGARIVFFLYLPVSEVKITSTNKKFELYNQLMLEKDITLINVEKEIKSDFSKYGREKYNYFENNIFYSENRLYNIFKKLGINYLVNIEKENLNDIIEFTNANMILKIYYTYHEIDKPKRKKGYIVNLKRELINIYTKEIIAKDEKIEEYKLIPKIGDIVRISNLYNGREVIIDPRNNKYYYK